MGSRARDYQEGTVIKCDFCADKVRQGLEPACVSTCVGRARFFGDLDDPTSEVSRLIATRGGTQLLVEKGTDPSIFYLR
jgi:Fe-S-cluster-containing dehydrogenase component